MSSSHADCLDAELFSDSTVVNERWRAVAAAHGATFVDLLPALKAERLTHT